MPFIVDELLCKDGDFPVRKAVSLPGRVSIRKLMERWELGNP